jgi:hypothetical protein
MISVKMMTTIWMISMLMVANSLTYILRMYYRKVIQERKVESPESVTKSNETLTGHCTEKKQYQKFETNIPRKGIAQPQSHFPHSRVCETFTVYILTIGLPIMLQEIMWTDPDPGNTQYKSFTDT